MPRRALLGLIGALVVLLPPSAYAVTVSRAELSSGQLRVEGRAAAGAGITVSSTSTATAISDSSGAFRVQASAFRSDTCQVTVSDGDRTATTTATLSGCTPATSSPPPPTPTSSCTLTPQAPATYNVGDLQTYFWSTTGCRTSNKPVKFNLVAGQIPPGMTGPFTQGVASGFVTGRPTTVGVFRFTVRVTDQTGAQDAETFQITVDPPRPVTITNQSSALSPGTVGEFYCCGNLFADGGTPGYTWTLRSGQIPPGLSLQASPGRITGTPTTPGTFSFLLRATDTKGAFAEGTFSITVT